MCSTMYTCTYRLHLQLLQLLFLLLLCLVATRDALLDHQQITIYADNCCKGRNESFTASARNFENISRIVGNLSMKSFSVNRGLWALSPDTNYSTVGIFRLGSDKEKDPLEHDTITGTCSSTARGNGEYTQYRSMRHIGNSFIYLAGLSLFTSVNFFGPELYFDGTALKLPSTAQFRSYGFTGRGVSWTIFNGVNYTGNGTCLKGQERSVSYVLSKRDQFLGRPATEEDSHFTIGSIQRGCSRLDKNRVVQQSKLVVHSNQITLHTKVNQHGSELQTDANELRLPSTALFKSYSFIGSKNWTVYHGVDFSGPARCLLNPKSTPKATLAKFNGTAIHQSINLVVGSVKRGCEEDPVREVKTAPAVSTYPEGRTSAATAAVIGTFCDLILFTCLFEMATRLYLRIVTVTVT